MYGIHTKPITHFQQNEPLLQITGPATTYNYINLLVNAYTCSVYLERLIYGIHAKPITHFQQHETFLQITGPATTYISIFWPTLIVFYLLLQ